ncbi:MAG: hypothetical protein MRY83_21520, partial [Flavobacteriales bacterium]|nr:hypothetical protein [Flavobacteriales bacterium]
MKNGLFKNFIVLLTGTAGAQLIHLLAAPVISRLYDADTFGEFGIIMGILGVLVVIVNGKFDAAILVPKGDSEAKKVFSISTLFGFLFSLLFAAIVIFISNEVSSKLNVNRAALGFTLYFCFIIAFNKSFIGWMTRKSMFREIAWGKILQTSGTVFFTILMYYAFPEIGLVVGTMFGWFIATF